MKLGTAASGKQPHFVLFFFRSCKIRENYNVKFKLQNFLHMKTHVVRNIVEVYLSSSVCIPHCYWTILNCFFRLRWKLKALCFHFLYSTMGPWSSLRINWHTVLLSLEHQFVQSQKSDNTLLCRISLSPKQMYLQIILLNLTTKTKAENKLGQLNPKMGVDLCKFIPKHRYLPTHLETYT